MKRRSSTLTRIAKLGTVASVVCLLSAGTGGQELPRATKEHGAFAFPDADGTRLLVAADVSLPDLLREAACSNGRRFPVRYDRKQAGGEGAQGRQGTAVFAQVAGTVYRVAQGTVAPREEVGGVTCFIASDSLRSSATWLSVTPAARDARCGSDEQQRVAASRTRAVANCWAIANLPDGRSVLLAEFARQDQDALAALVWFDGSRPVFADLRAAFRAPGQDLWRADDGGVLTPDGFQVVFALQRAGSVVLGVNWAGAEGRLLSVYASGSGNHFAQVIRDYWYQAPH